MPQVWLVGEPSDLRALLGYGDVAQRNQDGNPALEPIERAPSVLEMRVVGEKGEGGKGYFCEQGRRGC